MTTVSFQQQYDLGESGALLLMRATGGLCG